MESYGAATHPPPICRTLLDCTASTTHSLQRKHHLHGFPIFRESPLFAQHRNLSRFRMGTMLCMSKGLAVTPPRTTKAARGLHFASGLGGNQRDMLNNKLFVFLLQLAVFTGARSGDIYPGLFLSSSWSSSLRRSSLTNCVFWMQRSHL